MAQPVGALRVDLSAGHAQFAKDMGKARSTVQKNAKGMSSAMNKVSKSFTNTVKSIGAMAAAYVGLYAAIREMKAIVTQAANYETALVNMAKVTGLSFEEIDKIIKGIAPEIGNYTELMKGYYQTISAGVTEPVKALKMLVAASKLAKIAGIEQGETVKALTKVMMGYGGEIETAADASDLLLAIEKKGQTQVSELVPVIGKLATISKMSGLSSEAMGGALAVLTQTAGSTAEATDMLSAALTTLIKPTPAMTKEFEEFGGAINFIKEAGFEEWLKRIQKASGGTQEALTQMLGGKKNASLAIASLLMHMDTLNEDITEMKNRTGKAATAWEDYEKTSNAALDKFKNNIHNLEIVLGTALLPALNDVTGKTSEWVKQNEKLIGQKFEEYVKGTTAALKDLIAVYKTIPSEAIDAGIVGLVLAGKYGPFKLAFLLLAVNDAMGTLGNSLGDMKGKSNALAKNVKNLWDVLTGKRDWNTGALRGAALELDNLARAAKRSLEEIKKVQKGAPSSTSTKGAPLDDTVIEQVVNPNEAAIIKQIEALRLQRDTFGMATKEIVLYNLALLKATPDQLKLAEAILETTEEMKAYAATDEAVIQMMADIAEGVKLTEKSFEDLSEAEKKAMEDLSDTGKTAMETLTDAVNGFGAQSSQAMTDFALHGESSFSDMIDSMIEDLIRMMIQEQIMGPLFKGISGGLSGLFPSAKGNAFQGGNVVPFAKGGVFTKPTIFPMAQGAGLVGDAGAEAAMPLTRMANGNLGVESSGGGGMQVTIYNTTGDRVETKQGTTADGSPTLDVMIDQAVAKKLGQFGSQSNKSMRQNFGASQRLTRR